MASLTRRVLLSVAAAVVLSGAAAAVFLFDAATEKTADHQVFAVEGVALRGTDPVAYFKQGEPVPGKPEFHTQWNGVEWHFASAENRDAFLANPVAFAPQYGGYCAWAIAEKGQLASTQPENWAIVDDKLYLNYNGDVQRRWQVDIPHFIAEGDRKWHDLSATSQ